ncbi:MAG: hypothetical protein KF789_08475 [Bdellovibrionaceae bacterium]|nr:hypothetical protein [Pseudobdellovibrionaceae bacterium]
MKKSIYQGELVPHGYNHMMLYTNIFHKNYLCLSRHSVHIEPRQVSQQVYIGSHWKNIIFPDHPPMMIANDFDEFFELVQKNHGDLRSFFEKQKAEGIKIYATTDKAKPFFYYFLAELDLTFDLGQETMAILIRKSNERFLIWDRQDLGLSFSDFKAERAKLARSKQPRLMSKADLMQLPTEVLLILYSNKKITAAQFSEKLVSVRDKILGLSLANACRSALESIFNNPVFLKKYNGHDIEGSDNTYAILKSDPFLKKLFVDEIRPEDAGWAVKNQKKISSILDLLKESSLEKHDAVPEAEEFKVILSALYSPNPAQTMSQLFSAETFGFHELSFFQEDRHKVNTTLVNYVSIKQIQKRG